jgi:outer membrane protein OmpA-like peptidoglycan-associated protein
MATPPNNIDRDPIGSPNRQGERIDINLPEEDGLDTGIGGFYIPPENAPEGKSGIYSYDVGDPTRPYGDDPGYPIKNEFLQGGRVNVDHREKDLSITTKVTLGHFLGKSTTTNKIKIDAPERTEEYSEFSVKRNVDGTTPQLLLSKNSITFSGLRDTSGVVEQWKKPRGPVGWIGGRDQIEDPIIAPNIENIPLSKGHSKPEGATSAEGFFYRDGNTLLPEVQQNVAAISSFVSPILQNNRFTPNVRVSPDVFQHPRFGEVSSTKMSRVAKILSLRATGDHNISQGEVKNLIDSNLPKMGLQKIPNINFDVAEIISFLKITNDEDVNFVNISSTSGGLYNSVDEEFEGFSKPGMMAFFVANAIGLIAIASINSIMPSLLPGIKRAKGPDDIQLGTSRARANDPSFAEGLSQIANKFSPLTGINLSQYAPVESSSYFVAAIEGILSFFGDDATSRATRFTSQVFSNSEEGQIIIVGRIISKAIAKSFASLRSLVSSKFNVSQISSYVQNIFNQKIIDIINVFAIVGDSILQRDDYRKRLRDADKKSYGLNDDSTDFNSFAGYDDPHVPGKKKSENSLPWSLRHSKMLINLNPGSRGLIHNPKFRTGGIEDFERQFRNESSSRLPIDAAKVIEGYLQSDYVPFYFHDTRTNEIISFHAFLESLNESYTAQIDNVDAMGRVEPIKIYKGAQRKISFSFFVAALSEIDFHYMWLRINKLITLVYPQYTEGRMLEANYNEDVTFKFIQPFSQMMSASPLVRLRVGNLIRSNYTVRAMEGLFGANVGDTFNLEALPPAPSQHKKDQSFYVLFNTAVSKVWRTGTGDFHLAKQYIAHYLREDPGIIEEISLTGYADERDFDSYKSENSLMSGNEGLSFDRAETIKREILSITRASEIASLIKVKAGNETNVFSSGPRKRDQLAQNRRVVINVRLKTGADPSKKGTEPGLVTVTKSNGEQETIDQKKLNRAILIRDFMKPENNSIVKTFYEAGAGGGQAGFIESMSFDWINNQTTWDVEPGRKAPKLCKITVEFAPIHDISPGLDSQGNNRAPIYRVAEGETAPLIDETYESPDGKIVLPTRGQSYGAGISTPTLDASIPNEEPLAEDEEDRKRRVAARRRALVAAQKSSGGAVENKPKAPDQLIEGYTSLDEPNMTLGDPAPPSPSSSPAADPSDAPLEPDMSPPEMPPSSTSSSDPNRMSAFSRRFNVLNGGDGLFDNERAVRDAVLAKERYVTAQEVARRQAQAEFEAAQTIDRTLRSFGIKK